MDQRVNWTQIVSSYSKRLTAVLKIFVWLVYGVVEIGVWLLLATAFLQLAIITYDYSPVLSLIPVALVVVTYVITLVKAFKLIFR